MAFDRTMYLGQFIEYNMEDDVTHIHFVEKSSLSSGNSFVWPELSGKASDTSRVEQGMFNEIALVEV